MGTEAGEFGQKQAPGVGPSTAREQLQVTTGQLGMLKAIFCGRTIVEVSPDPKRRHGLLLKLSDGKTIGIKPAPQPKCLEVALIGSSLENQPRRFLVGLG